MTMDKFLSFWDHYNTRIIEGLVALVILLSLILAYRSFFAKKSKGDSVDAGNGLDAAQLEKTLQKILENQQSGGGRTSRSAHAEDLSTDVDLDAMEQASVSDAGASDGGSAESAAEVVQLRSSLNESAKKVEALQAQLKDALQAAEAAAAAPAAAGGAEAGGMSAAEKEEMNGKLRDLEARLAEYEIISEDIADLSRYREENDNLKKELEALKAGRAQPAAAAPAAEPVVEAAPEPEPEPTPSEPVSVEPPVQADAATPDAPAEPAATGGADLIDDELMKEFAAAVEGQKALDKAADKAGDGSQKAAATGDETDKLMNEFENFVSKKS
ncbi:hypothetical protein AZI85_14515 [Bdellovibrio bacteriovorus]|uniref:Uncharacterized protein n=2 Tax=Bdellovibrio bacteriovorus TaxID=959 RepID=A0A150WV42_BDEBC|nr:hypothetical protein AZI85_14515 [Bdellovibrio bacteriovorus]